MSRYCLLVRKYKGNLQELYNPITWQSPCFPPFSVSPFNFTQKFNLDYQRLVCNFAFSTWTPKYKQWYCKEDDRLSKNHLKHYSAQAAVISKQSASQSALCTSTVSESYSCHVCLMASQAQEQHLCVMINMLLSIESLVIINMMETNLSLNLGREIFAVDFYGLQALELTISSLCSGFLGSSPSSFLELHQPWDVVLFPGMRFSGSLSTHWLSLPVN